MITKCNKWEFFSLSKSKLIVLISNATKAIRLIIGLCWEEPHAELSVCLSGQLGFWASTLFPVIPWSFLAASYSPPSYYAYFINSNEIPVWGYMAAGHNWLVLISCIVIEFTCFLRQSWPQDSGICTSTRITKRLCDKGACKQNPNNWVRKGSVEGMWWTSCRILLHFSNRMSPLSSSPSPLLS